MLKSLRYSASSKMAIGEDEPDDDEMDWDAMREQVGALDLAGSSIRWRHPSRIKSAKIAISLEQIEYFFDFFC